MADGGCSDKAENDVVELEAMRKDTLSWHPCQVSLCPTGSGLIVQYEDYSEEMFSDKEGVLAHVRVRSTPLQGDDCSSLCQGDHVLANRNSKVKGLFYDARVEEAIHVRHTKRIHCRCSFRIKWLHEALDKMALTVPASVVMKISTESIILHPTISTFFSMLECSNGLDTSPLPSFVDSMNLEMDISMVLEKQILEISNSADASQKKTSNSAVASQKKTSNSADASQKKTSNSADASQKKTSNSADASQKKISKKVVVGLKADLKGQNHGTAVDASLKHRSVTVPLPNNLKGSNGSENTQSMKAIDPPDFIPSIREQFTGSKLPLSPLAARAALALLRSQFPQHAEVPVCNNVENGDITSSAPATLGGRSPKFESIVKTLFATSSDPQVVESSNISSRAQVNRLEKKNKNTEKRKTQPSEKRLTRAQVQKNDEMHESTEAISTKKTQLRSSSSARRVTRSSVEAEKIELEELHAAVEEDMPDKSVQLDTPVQKTITPKTRSSDKQKLVASPIDGKINACSTVDEKSLLEKDRMLVKGDNHKGESSDYTDRQKYPKRITRSAAREEMEKNSKLRKD